MCNLTSHAKRADIHLSVNNLRPRQTTSLCSSSILPASYITFLFTSIRCHG